MIQNKIGNAGHAELHDFTNDSEAGRAQIAKQLEALIDTLKNAQKTPETLRMATLFLSANNVDPTEEKNHTLTVAVAGGIGNVILDVPEGMLHLRNILIDLRDRAKAERENTSGVTH